MFSGRFKNKVEETNGIFRNVELYVEFVRIGEIDTMNEKYQAEVNIEAKWIETNHISTYDPNAQWNPKLYIENILQEAKESVKYLVVPINEGGFVIIEKRNVKGVFWERLELHNFPLDIQELSITVSSKLNSNEINLLTDPSRISNVNMHATHTFVEQQKWKLFRLVKMSHTASYDLPSGSQISINDLNELESLNSDSSPKLVATCYCSRKAGYYIFNAFFLIFLITVSSITIFSVDCKLPQSRLQTSYTLLLTSISFKWVVNRSLPTVSYLTSLDSFKDKYAIASIFYICLLCVWHSIVGSNWSKDLATSLDNWLLIFFSCLFVLFHVVVVFKFYLAYRKIGKLKSQETQFLKSIGHQIR